MRTLTHITLFVLSMLAVPLALTGITMHEFAADCHAGGGTVHSTWADWGLTTCVHDAQDVADSERIARYADAR